MRVKLWTRDGTILYSDEPRADRAALRARRRRSAELFETGGADAELSDLAEPENRYERQEGKLLEAHTPIRTPDGTPVLFETYQRFGAVSASASRLLRALAPPLLGGAGRAAAAPGPARLRSLARRLQRGHAERERLLARAIEASEQRAPPDRRRPARRRRPGPRGRRVRARAARRRRERRGDEAKPRAATARSSGCARACATCARCSSRSTRRSLESAGLERRARRPAEPAARARGLADDARGRAGRRRRRPARLPRRPRGAAQRRRARRSATRVRGRASRAGRSARLRDRRRPRLRRRASASARREEGHVGLTLLEDLVAQAGGTLAVRSAARRGNDGRDGGADAMIRVLLADDHGVIRDGLGAADRRRSTTSSWSGRAADGAEAVERARALRARRDPDGPRHAGARRHRGDAADRRRAPATPPCSC